MQFKVTFKDVNGEWTEMFIVENVRSPYAAVRFGRNQVRMMNDSSPVDAPEIEFVSAELVRPTRLP